MSWLIDTNTLCYLKSDGTLYVPSAAEIFCVLFGGSFPEGSLFIDKQVIETPKWVFPEVRFSKIGTRLGIELSYCEDSIRCDFFVTHRGERKKIPNWQKYKADHVIVDGMWLYFTENHNEIIDLIESSQFERFPDLHFPEYLQLIFKAKDNPSVLIDNKVNTDIFESLLYSKKKVQTSINAKLYPYQQIGFEWMNLITSDGGGCILGDEMGLGKTLQVITLIQHRKSQRIAPTLVVAPVSLLENWRREIAKFAPSLSVLVNHGTHRFGSYKKLLDYDVVIISFASVISDSSMLCMIKWDMIVADEAQNIKNPLANRTVFLKQIPCRSAIAVTGTPFENHMSDIWSIVNFVVPTLLGSFQDFNRHYEDTPEAAKRIEPVLSSIMLRRRVSEVAQDLPNKIIIPQALIMCKHEAELYEKARKKVLSTYSGTSGLMVELLKMRMFCAHYSLLQQSLDMKSPIDNCIKYERLCEILLEIKSLNEKAILFTSFIKMAEILRDDIPKRLGIAVSLINGETPVEARQSIIDDFEQIEGTALLVLNPKAAGAGLNITAANHVIHYNLEWNPAVEDQATARAFRRGQTKNVFIYRLFYSGTVEEFVNDKIDLKRELSDIAVVGNDGTKDTRSLILQAMQMSPIANQGANSDE